MRLVRSPNTTALLCLTEVMPRTRCQKTICSVKNLSPHFAPKDGPAACLPFSLPSISECRRSVLCMTHVFSFFALRSVCSVGCVIAAHVSQTQHSRRRSLRSPGWFESLLSTHAVVCHAKLLRTAPPRRAKDSSSVHSVRS